MFHAAPHSAGFRAPPGADRLGCVWFTLRQLTLREAEGERLSFNAGRQKKTRKRKYVESMLCNSTPHLCVSPSSTYVTLQRTGPGHWPPGSLRVPRRSTGEAGVGPRPCVAPWSPWRRRSRRRRGLPGRGRRACCRADTPPLLQTEGACTVRGGQWQRRAGWGIWWGVVGW